MNSMFESIKGSLNKKSGGGYSEILKMEVGKTYEVKLLPYSPEYKDTFFEYYMHGWTSFATGGYVQILSPTTFNERDPISEERFKILKLGTPEEQERIKTVRRGQKWMVNVLVIKDPTNPENEGKVKILRYGKQLHKIITDAMDGDDADEFGMEKIFTFGPGNAVLKIKVDDQGDFASYTSSRFTTGTKFTLEGQELQRVLGSVHNLRAVYEPKSFDEVKAFFDTHYHVAAGKAEPKNEKASKSQKGSFSTTDDDKLIAELSGAGAGNFEDQAPIPDFGDTGDDEIDALLKDIG